MHTSNMSKTVISNSIHTCMTVGSYNAHFELNGSLNIQALNINLQKNQLSHFLFYLNFKSVLKI